jgi:hypothetical protein
MNLSLGGLYIFSNYSESFSSDSSGKLNVSGHDRHSSGVDRTQVGVLEQSHQVGFSSLLQRKNSAALESQFLLEIVSDFSHESLERQLSDQQFS